jgi:hypothetical protein
MIKKFDYGSTCWWCGNKADSAEHRYKRTDLIREFGRPPYHPDDAPIRVVGNENRVIRGPNSREVKFPKNLCYRCNTTRSQSFDRSYDTFISYISRNEHEILETAQFRFSAIFSPNWQAARLNLIKYLAKHICCRLAYDNVLVSSPVLDFLEGRQPLSHINMRLEIRTDIAEAMSGPSLWLGDAIFMLNRKTGEWSEFRSHYGYRWLRFSYTYDEAIGSAPNNFPQGDIVSLYTGKNENWLERVVRRAIGIRLVSATTLNEIERGLRGQSVRV